MPLAAFSLALLFSVAATLHGLSSLKWPDVLPMANWTSARGYILFMVCSGLLILITRQTTGASIPQIVLGACLAIGIIAGGSWSMLVLMLIGLSSFASGQTALRLLGVSTGTVGDLSRLVLGAGLLASVVSIAAHFRINNSFTYYILLFAPIWTERVSLRSKMAIVADCLRGSPAAGGLSEVRSMAIGCMVILHFTLSFLPTGNYDALAMHLFVPEYVSNRHEWGFDASLYVWALMPMLGDWSFTIAYMLGGEVCCRLLNVCSVFVLAGLARELVRWAGGTRNGESWASLLFLATPLTYLESTSLNIDPLWTCYLVAGLLALLNSIFDERRRALKVIVAGALFGLAAAAKAVTFTYLPWIALVAVSRAKAFFVPLVRWRVVQAMILFSLLGCIPYLGAYIATGNPLFPFFNSLFKSPLYPLVNFSDSRWSVGASLDLPYQIVFASERYIEGTTGVPGFQWITLFLPTLVVIAIRENVRGVSLVVIGLASLVTVFHFESYLRYIFPVFVVASSLIGVAMSTPRKPETLIDLSMGVVGVATLCLNLLFLSSGVWTFRDIPVVQAFGQDNHEDFIQSRLPMRKAVELVNALNADSSPVAFLSEPLGAGIRGDALYANWYNPTFEKAVLEAGSPEGFGSVLAKYRARYFILDSNWGTREAREASENASTKIKSFASISVRVVREDLIFVSEMLANPKLEGITGWHLSPGNSLIEGGGIVVSQKAPATQTVAVQEGTRYLNTVRARCSNQPTSARVQVNWLDKSGEFIKADIKIFDCRKEWRTESQLVVAPIGAGYATVYATGHETASVEISLVSLKK